MRTIFVVTLLVFAICICSSAEAHRGRTDSSGGHYNRKTGEYHLHSSKGSKSSAKTYKIKTTRKKRR